MSTLTVFKSSFTGDVVSKGDVGYPEAIMRWALNAQRDARHVAFPKTTDDIALALKFARANGIGLAVRGGGHSPGGSSSRTDGLVIDLSRYFKDVRVDEKNRLAHIGGGAIWQTVDEECIKFGLASVGGTVNHTGVGGLILGGGYGWLAPEHGLCIDNLEKVTMVLASGEVVTTSDSENQELFFGVRGGGGNFGIVTEFVMRLHEQRKTVFAGPILFPRTPEMLEKVVAATDAWWKTASVKEGVFFIMARAPGTGAPACGLVAFYNGSEEEGKARFKDFFDLNPIMSHAQEIPYEKLNSMLAPFSTPGQNYYFKATDMPFTAFEAPSTLLSTMSDLHARLSDPAVTPLRVTFSIELYPTERFGAGDANQTMAFSGRSHDFVGMTIISWAPEDSSLENSAKAKETAHALINTVDKAKGTKREEIYPNYFSESTETSNAALRRLYGGSRYERLLALKKKYDPELVFDRWYAPNPKAEA